MHYGKEAYKKDIPHLEKVKKFKDPLSFTYLFDKYFNIVLAHLKINFRNVRIEILEDVAIETIEDWFLNIDNKDYEVNLLGYNLCLNAKGTVFKILRPKFKVIPASDLTLDEHVQKNSFIDIITYTTFSGVKGQDQAKINFLFKKKADQFIGELGDKDYNLITGFLDGLNTKQRAEKAGIHVRNLTTATQFALKHLKELIFDNRNTIFEKQRKQYLKTNIKFKHPEVMQKYYVEKLSISEISEAINVSYNIVKGWLKRDRDKMKFNGLSYYQLNKNKFK